MANIKALKPEVYNLIAAGEVVDNPVGAVKELVENCIDAGAHRITIEIAGGGLEQITVTDDGCGIHEEDVELAFAKYATSKLATADDMTGIQSLGFRGEALSSIAAVSRIKLTTRLKDAEVGVCVTVENGVVSDKQYVAANFGTKIEVRDLYYTAPVRKKFLKNEAGEKANISKFVAKFILTNPNVAITYVADGKKVYESKGNGLDEAIFAVYGADCLSSCIPINYNKDDLRIFGYIGTPDYSKANKNYQTLAVNGRCVADVSVAGAIMQAYQPYLMTRKFPFYVLSLEIPAVDVDVNVHPKKTEVRFAKSRYVCAQFYHAVQDALLDHSSQYAEQVYSLSSRFDDNAPRIYDTDTSKVTHTKEDVAATIERLKNDGEIETMNRGQSEDVRKIEWLTDEQDKEREFEAFAKEMEREISVAKARQRMGMEVVPASVKQRPKKIQDEEPSNPAWQFPEIKLMDRARILGIAFKTYLIVEFEGQVMFIDQHAAHERILFDQFLQGASADMQQLMFPYTFTVRDEEAVFIQENLSNIFSAGFEIEEFGHNTFRITAVSRLLVDTKMADFVEFLLGSIDEFKLDDRKLIVEAIAKKACKAAVKAGETLSEYEIEYLLQQIADNKILQCPHGRPITVTFTKAQMEKMFKRIV